MAFYADIYDSSWFEDFFYEWNIAKMPQIFFKHLLCKMKWNFQVYLSGNSWNKIHSF